MYCPKCGKQVLDTDAFCAACGEPLEVRKQAMAEEPKTPNTDDGTKMPVGFVPPQKTEPAAECAAQPAEQPVTEETSQQTQDTTPKSKYENYAVAALVCGILGMFIPFAGIVLAILAIVFGSLAKKNLPEGRTGMAVAGFVLGIISLVLNIMVIVAVVGMTSVLISAIPWYY